jgi:hypothetical protein
MRCIEATSLLADYLDGAADGQSMRGLAQHLAKCQACSAQLATLKQTQQLVASLGRKQPPPELALRLRLALSREAAHPRRGPVRVFLDRLEEAADRFMVPATAGLLSAIIFFGLLIGFFAMPAQLQAAEDVPTMLYTPPMLAASPFGIGLGNLNTDSVVIEAFVDANGRVQDYRVLSSPDDAGEITPELNNMLIFTVFRPATAFGRPTTGRAILSFSKINVKG